jgi:hypothetical protein
VNGSGKHSSLLGYGNNCDCKKFYTGSPWSHKKPRAFVCYLPLVASSPKVFPRTDGHIFLGTSDCQNSFSGRLQIGERDQFQNRKEMFKRERQKDKAIPIGSQIVEDSPWTKYDEACCFIQTDDIIRTLRLGIPLPANNI